MEDIRLEGRAGRLGQQLTAVMYEGVESREYRMATRHELDLPEAISGELDAVFGRSRTAEFESR